MGEINNTHVGDGFWREKKRGAEGSGRTIFVNLNQTQGEKKREKDEASPQKKKESKKKPHDKGVEDAIVKKKQASEKKPGVDEKKRTKPRNTFLQGGQSARMSMQCGCRKGLVKKKGFDHQTSRAFFFHNRATPDAGALEKKRKC